MSEPLIRLHRATRVYPSSAEQVVALDAVNLKIAAGECVAIVGPSGSGKSTLLNLLGLLDRPTSGRHDFAGHAAHALDNRARARLRNRHIGFVFQQFHLLPHLTALENVALPMQYTDGERDIAAQASAALEQVGLGHRLDHLPNALSGGERQRVAIARAMVMRPHMLLADEPTGALDSANGKLILDMMLELNRQQGVTLVVVTHDLELARSMHRCIHMRDGRITDDA